ncbi:hypothetical protein O181_020922 [Austropuccinia psidii MF-1]|uniref:Uncharacterized protein n=1 Tax=Austropuccinia psidii MF-1 TaxID=1389203 RepID=A0A9Q3CCK0_9BASI|nr:hypothetical protein [Austropuccinia psidii MF-1]
MGNGLTGETREGLEVEGFWEGGGREDSIVERTCCMFLGVHGMTLLWNLLEEGWERQALDWWSMELGTTSTSSTSSSSLPSALGLVDEFAILLNILNTPWLLIPEMGNSELE